MVTKPDDELPAEPDDDPDDDPLDEPVEPEPPDPPIEPVEPVEPSTPSTPSTPWSPRRPRAGDSLPDDPVHGQHRAGGRRAQGGRVQRLLAWSTCACALSRRRAPARAGRGWRRRRLLDGQLLLRDLALGLRDLLLRLLHLLVVLERRALCCWTAWSTCAWVPLPAFSASWRRRRQPRSARRRACAASPPPSPTRGPRRPTAGRSSPPGRPWRAACWWRRRPSRRTGPGRWSAAPAPSAAAGGRRGSRVARTWPWVTFWPTFALIAVTVPLVPKFALTASALVTLPLPLTVATTVPLRTVAVRVVAAAAPGELRSAMTATRAAASRATARTVLTQTTGRAAAWPCACHARKTPADRPPAAGAWSTLLGRAWVSGAVPGHVPIVFPDSARLRSEAVPAFPYEEHAERYGCDLPRGPAARHGREAAPRVRAPTGAHRLPGDRRRTAGAARGASGGAVSGGDRGAGPPAPARRELAGRAGTPVP